MILILDLDGTLLDSRGKLPESTNIAIQKLSAEGWEIIFATARPIFGIQQFTNKLACVNFFVCCQGAQVARRYKGVIETLHTCHLPLETAKRIWQDAVSRQLDIWWISDDTWYASRRTEALENEERLIESTCEIIDEIPTISALKIMLLGDDRERELTIMDELNMVDTSLSNNGYIMEITNKGVGKGKSLEQYIRSNSDGICVTVGDSENDLSMFSVADLSVAVSTADKKILQVADKVIERDEENGIVDLYARINELL